MRNVIAFTTLIGLTFLMGGLAIIPSGCDEIEAPCDVQDTKKGDPWIDLQYLESWRIENGWGIFKFIWPKETVFFVCTDRTVDYSLTLGKRSGNTTFTILPQARLIWKYGAPSPSKAVLEGRGSFMALFDLSTETTTLYQNRISLAYSDGAFGGSFMPGVEIKIPSSGNLSDDYEYIWENFRLFASFEVAYRLTY
jgi:hypothetical protein